jgi:hypothetical protein
MARLTTKEIAASLEDYVIPDYVLRGFYLLEDHGWTAIAVDFDIAGSGATPHEAIADAEEGLIHYLWMCKEDGLSFEEAIRPAPADVQDRFNQALQAELDNRLNPGKHRKAMQAEHFKIPMPV